MSLRIRLFVTCCLLLPGVCWPTVAEQLASAIGAYSQADFVEAERILEEIDVEELTDPERVLRHKLLGAVKVAGKEVASGREEFLSLLELEPSFTLSRQDYSDDVVDVFESARAVLVQRYQEQGLSHYAGQRFAEAVQAFTRVLALDPNNTVAKELIPVVARAESEAQGAVTRRPQCTPSVVSAGMDARTKNCDGWDYSSHFSLPAKANRLTLHYDNHHHGVSDCWRLDIYEHGRILHSFTDPQVITRLQTVDLAGTHEITRVVMRSHDKKGEDHFNLKLEVVCPDE